MCDDCFATEIRSFTDRKAWASFDFELTRKLGQGKMKRIKFIPDRQRDKDDGEDIYECLSCGQGWRLKNHYGSRDGYFLKLSKLEKLATRLTETQKLTIRLLAIPLLILINVIYWLWTH